METQSLMVNRQLNYDEVVRRLQYWAKPSESDSRHASTAIRILADMLEREKHNLYFEGDANDSHHDHKTGA